MSKMWNDSLKYLSLHIRLLELILEMVPSIPESTNPHLLPPYPPSKARGRWVQNRCITLYQFVPYILIEKMLYFSPQ